MNLELATQVDAQKLAGEWHEIARSHFYMENYLAQVVLKVECGDPAKLELSGRLREPEGPIETHSATIRPTNPEATRWSMTLYDTLDVDLELLAHAEDYSWFMATNPNKRLFWWFAKQPGTSPEDFQAVVQFANQNGIEGDEIFTTAEHNVIELVKPKDRSAMSDDSDDE